MSISIKYYAADCNMGDTSAEDCELYREWAREQIEDEYPDADVEVVNQDSVRGVEVYADDESTEEEVLDFVSRLWDRCPWDFE